MAFWSHARWLSRRSREAAEMGGAPAGGGRGPRLRGRYKGCSWSAGTGASLGPAKMPLTAADKANVKAIWAHVAGRGEAFGTEILVRLFKVYPATKTYFPSYDLTPGSADMKAQGKKVADALTQAVGHLDDVAGCLSALSDLHATKLRVDPVNFEKLRECILVTLAAHHGAPLKADVVCSLDKFLCLVNRVLASKYR